MKKIVLTLLLVMFIIPSIYAEEQDILEEKVQEETKETDDGTKEEGPITLKSKSGIVIDASSKKILFEKNSNEQLAPASMTKIMTMLLIMEEIEKGNITLEDQVTISEHAANMGGSQIYLEAGKTASVKELLTSIGIGSANDSAVAMAEKIGGTEENFVNMMNKRASELGAKNTHFVNAHGLDADDHYSTAHDMAIIASELVKHESILDITGTYETTITHQNGKSIWLVNTNSLIRFYKGLDGLKTGFTERAGYCLTGTMERNDMRLITVVMNAEVKEDRNTDTINMMEYAFSQYYKSMLIEKEKSLGSIFIDNSKTREVKYYLKEDVSVILDKNTKDIKYKYDIELNEISAPLKNGDTVGKLILKYDNKEKEYELIVKEDVPEASYFYRMMNYLKDILSGNVNVIGN
ncbi:MAG: D-alanyl-D-alanine carboxypeptidase [Bacilli bacterium]|nr:D-alanyl-D-alanine carboxypeptidase [Bacilli bacterium]